jgi:uncharacterized glyoxalase superfamily protein PhnB
MFRKLSPVLVVETIEPCLPFWQALGFEVTVQVPHGDALGFAIVAKDAVEVMYQTTASVAADVPQAAGAGRPGAAALFIEVDDVREVARRVAAAPVVMAMRETPYGMREIFVRDPAGHVIGFAQPIER